MTILGTYKCTARCENCCFDSNPFLTERLSLPEILQFIQEAAELPTCKMVVFSGGECFLLGDDLVTAVAYATSLGMITRCVTNGFWAKHPEHGRTRLEPLVRAGLKELNLSTGDYHQRWVSQDTVVNAACLATDFGLPTVIMVELQRERRVTAADIAGDPRMAGRLKRDNPSLRILESPWMPMDHNDIIEQSENRMLSQRTLHMRGGCTSVLNTVVITPHRRFGFCCGLSREKIPELNADWAPGTFNDLVEAGNADFMKIWLWVDGPDRILAWAATKDSRIEWENRYSHHCQTCLALFSDQYIRDVIREHYRERVQDVLFRYTMRLREQQGFDTHLAP
ncbi:radical SAM protein [Nonomuraea sp. LPB2021202275-12-8]|uniref:radical SAM protein n=1 Tax=Nonomuraea sp. LPB2021202275-12-8 TaxID=3120159 RepID=UPI00300D6E6E